MKWANRTEPDVSALPVRKGITVRGLINAILKRRAGYQARIEHGVLHVINPVIGTSHQNFLNLRISEFDVKDANVFAAEASLRSKIDMTLHPQRYVGGYNGGHGHPADHTFSVRNISFSAHNLSVREILNKIVVANGNALWIVRLNPSKILHERFFAQDDGVESAGFHWRFIPLKSA